MTYAENVLSVFDRATPAQYDEGMTWYNDTHDMAVTLGGDAWRGAGVIAAYAANVKWPRTVFMATESLRTGIAYPGYLGNMVWQAQRILDGEHALDVLTGQKVRAFCAAIATNGESDIATIDRHAHDIAIGRVCRDDERKIGKRLFRTMSNHYVQAALEVGVRTAQIQAITWVRWRAEKGIRD